MDNEKDLDAKTANNAENTPAEEKNENAAADDALQKELSELASLFEEELKKAKKEAEERENDEELPPIQELEPVGHNIRLRLFFCHRRRTFLQG